MSVRVVLFDNPFKSERRILEVPAGTIRDVLTNLGVTSSETVQYKIIKNDAIATADDSVVDNDLLIVRAVPTGAGATKDEVHFAGKTSTVTGVLLMIVGSAVSATGVGAPLGGFLFGLGATTFAGGLIALAGSAFMDGPEEQKKRGIVRPDIRGASNQAFSNGKLPMVFGRHRIAPFYACQPYTTIETPSGADPLTSSGKNISLNLIFAIGYAPLSIEQVRIGDVVMASSLHESSGSETPLVIDGPFTGVSGSFVNGALPASFPSVVIEDQLDIALTPDRYGNFNTEATSIPELVVDASEWTMTAPVDTELDTEWGMGPGIMITFTNFVNAENNGTFRVLNVRPGPASSTNNQIVFATDSPAMADETKSDVTGYFAPANIKETADNTTRIDLIVTFPQGLAMYDGNSNDAQAHPDLVIRAYYRLKNTSSPNAWSDMPYFYGSSWALSGFKADSTIRFQSSKTGLSAGVYEVRVVREQGVIQLENTTYFNTAQWSALQSYVGGVPVFAADAAAKTSFLYLKVYATSALAGSLDQVSLVANSIYTESVTGADYTENYPSNPACAYLWALTSNINPRPLTGADRTTYIDYTTIAAWKDYCNTEVDSAAFHTCNAVITEGMSLLDMLNRIASTGRGFFVMKDGKYSVCWDAATSTIIQLITPRNSKNFQGSKSFAEIPLLYKARFVNADNEWTEDEQLVYAYGGSASDEPKEAISVWGITDPAEVCREGRYSLACRKLRPESYMVDLDAEQLACTIGDRVQVAHDALMVGSSWGRVNTVVLGEDDVVVSFTTDELITMATGNSYAVRVRNATGSIYAAVNTVNGEFKEVVFTTPQAAGSVVAGDLFQHGLATLESLAAIVVNIEPQDDLSARLTLVPYDESVFDADSHTPPAFATKISKKPIFLPKVVESEVVRQEASPTTTTLSALGTSALDRAFEARYRELTSLSETGDYIGQIATYLGKRYKWSGAAWVSIDMAEPKPWASHDLAGLPDYPDDPAWTTYKNPDDWATGVDGWTGKNATLSIENGYLKYVTTAASPTNTYISRVISSFPSAGKVVIIRCKILAGTYSSITFLSNGRDFNTNIAVTTEWKTFFVQPSSSGDITSIIIDPYLQSSDFAMAISDIYIGTGSTLTPPIDNSGNGHHLTANALIPVVDASAPGGRYVNLSGKPSYMRLGTEIPDDTAGTTYVQPTWATTDNWVGAYRSTVSVENGTLKSISSGAGSYIQHAALCVPGKYIQIKIKAAAPGTYYAFYYSGSGDVNFLTMAVTTEFQTFGILIPTGTSNAVLYIRLPDGSTSYIKHIYIGTGAYLSQGFTSAFHMALPFYLPAASTTAKVVWGQSVDYTLFDGAIALIWNFGGTSGRLALVMRTASGEYLGGYCTPTASTWYYGSIQYNQADSAATALGLYLNGVLQTLTSLYTGATRPAVYNGVHWFGARAGASMFCDMRIGSPIVLLDYIPTQEENNWLAAGKPLNQKYSIVDYRLYESAADGKITPQEKRTYWMPWAREKWDAVDVTATTPALASPSGLTVVGEYKTLVDAALAAGITVANATLVAYRTAWENCRAYFYATPFVLLSTYWDSTITVTTSTLMGYKSAYNAAADNLRSLIAGTRANTAQSTAIAAIPTNAPKYLGPYDGDAFPSSKNNGDWVVCSTTADGYTKGLVYEWSGSAWVETTAPDKLNRAMSDLLDLAATDTSGPAVVFAQSIIAMNATILALQARILFIQNVLYGGERFDENGNVIDETADGFYLPASGSFQFEGPELSITKDRQRFYKGAGIQRRAMQTSDESLDWWDTPDGGTELLRGRIGRLGVGDEILMDGSFNAEIESQFGDEIVINAANSSYANYIQLEDGELRVSYKRGSDGYLIERTWSGTAWGAESVINADTSDMPSYIQLQSGELRIAYINADGYLVERTWGGSAWGDESTINSAASWEPDYIQLQNGELRIAYRLGANNYIVERRWGGSAWGDAVSINAAASYYPNYIQLQNGELRVAYKRDADGYLVERTWGGSAWGDESVISNVDFYNNNYIQLLDGELRVVYSRASDIYIVERIWDGSAWGAESVINGAISYYPNYIQLQNGELRIAYRRGSDTYLIERTLRRYAKIGAGVIEDYDGASYSWRKYGNGDVRIWGSVSLTFSAEYNKFTSYGLPFTLKDYTKSKIMVTAQTATGDGQWLGNYGAYFDDNDSFTIWGIVEDLFSISASFTFTYEVEGKLA